MEWKNWYDYNLFVYFAKLTPGSSSSAAELAFFSVDPTPHSTHTHTNTTFIILDAYFAF